MLTEIIHHGSLYVIPAMLFTIIMGESTFSVLTSILTLYYHHHGAETRPPKIIRRIAFHYLARILCMRNQVPLDTQEIPQLKEEISVITKAGEMPTYIANHVAQGNNGMVSPECKPVMDQSETYLREMLSYIKELAAKIHLKERDDVIMQEWKSVAKVIDRTFFWIAFIFTLIAVPVLLFHQDKSHD